MGREVTFVAEQLLFGTDVGYMGDYSTEGRVPCARAMRSHLQDILQMLTAAVAERFEVADEKGTITPGKIGDLVVLEGDPNQDITLLRAEAPPYVRGPFFTPDAKIA